MTKAGNATSRPLKLAKFQDLEAEFRQRGADRAFLEQLVGELSVRSTKSAARLSYHHGAQVCIVSNSEACRSVAQVTIAGPNSGRS